MDKIKMEVGYRHIPPSDYHTPKMYLPMQRTNMLVASPYGKEQVIDAIMGTYPGWFRRIDIRDVEFFEPIA